MPEKSGIMMLLHLRQIYHFTLKEYGELGPVLLLRYLIEFYYYGDSVLLAAMWIK